MSVEQLAVVLHHSEARGTARLVLLGIANHAGDGGAYPSVATLARYAGGVTTRNVQNAIRQLEAMGEVRVSYRAGGGPTTPDHLRTNRYDVLVSCPSTCDRSPQHRDLRRVDHPLSLATWVP